MNEHEFGKAMGSKHRTEILRLISTQPMSVEGLSKNLGLGTIATRHHVKTLEKAHLIEEFEEKKAKIGRPTVYYRATRTPMSISFPQRDYYLLADIIMEGLRKNLNPDQLRKMVKHWGEEMGCRLSQELTEQFNVKRWDIDAIRHVLIENYLTSISKQPLIIKQDNKSIHFRTYNCLFFEVSKKYPYLMCEAFDVGMLNALLNKTLGTGAGWKQLKCMGHGDDYCEYIFSCNGNAETDKAQRPRTFPQSN